MFGYVRPFVPELRVREFEYYRAVYCGVCRSMSKRTGKLSTLSLQYDFAFLALVRHAWSDTPLRLKKRRCGAHPLRARVQALPNEELFYCARAGAVLAAEKLRDDRMDGSFGKKLTATVAAPVFGRARRRAKLTESAAFIRSKLNELYALEKERTASLDLPADLFGEVLAEVFAGELCGEAEDIAWEIGFRLGRLIYAVDAADDYDEDCKTDSYNPYVLLYGKEWSEENRRSVRVTLKLMLSDLEEALSRLPWNEGCSDHYIAKAIVDNVLYLGLIKKTEGLWEKPEKRKQSDFSAGAAETVNENETENKDSEP